MNRARTTVSAPIARVLAVICIASFAASGSAQSQSAGGVLAGLASVAPAAGAAARPFVSIQIDGRITAVDGQNDHEVELAAGQHFNAVVMVAAGGRADRTVDVKVFRKNRVTGELTSITGAYARLEARIGKPLATGVVWVPEKGTFVVRVKSSAVGPYSVVVAPLDRGPVGLGSTVLDSMTAASGTRDYQVSARPGEHFNVTISASASSNPDREVSVKVFRKNRVTGELSSVTGAYASLQVRGGEPVASGVVSVKEAMDFVVRVQSNDVGAYTLTPTSLVRGNAQLGAKIEATMAAVGDTHDYVISVRRGQTFHVVVEAKYTDNPDREVSVKVFRRNRVTGELSSVTGAYASLEVRDGDPVATGVVTVTEAMDYVIRVQSNDVGLYSITPRPASAR